MVAIVRQRQVERPPIQDGFGHAVAVKPSNWKEPIAAGVVIATAGESPCVLTTYSAVQACVGSLNDEKTDRRVHLILNGGHAATGVVIAADSRFDLAALRLETDPNRPPIDAFQWSPHALLKGSLSVVSGEPNAILRDGSPRAALATVAGSTATAWNGTLAETTDRVLQPADLLSIWQLETRATGGTDGGAVVDLGGQLQGLTISRVSLPGHDSTATFAIAIENLQSEVIDWLLRGREPQLGFFGFETKTTDGIVVISKLARGTPADEAGLVPGDVVLSVQGDPVAKAWQLHRRMWLTSPGERTILKVRRTSADGQVRERDIELTAIRWPVREGETVFATGADVPTWRGILVDDATSRLWAMKEGLFGRLRSGVLVRAVADNGSLLQAGDFVTAVNDHPVSTPAEFTRAVADVRGAVRLQVGGEREVIVGER